VPAAPDSSGAHTGPSALLAFPFSFGIAERGVFVCGIFAFAERRKEASAGAATHREPDDQFYEVPHRVAESIADAREILGDRPACLAREVTKLHEEFRRGKLSELSASLEERPARGEITLLIGPEDAAEARANVDSTQSCQSEWMSLYGRRNWIARTL